MPIASQIWLYFLPFSILLEYIKLCMQIYKFSQESVKKHSDYKFPFHFILGFSIVLEAAIKQTSLKKKTRKRK